MKSSPPTRPLEKFFALQAQPCSQTGVIRLEKGGASSESPDCDSDRDQTVLLIEGELLVELGNAGQRIHPGTPLTVPAGVKHRFVNLGEQPALAFTVFS